MDEKAKTLWAALARAQGKITEPELDKENPHYHSRYASLASVWKAFRGPLSSEGLCIVQGVARDASDRLILMTRLIHESGEDWSFECPILSTKNDMQGLGGAITYARRYSLNAMIGTSGDEDLDGNEPEPKLKQKVKTEIKSEPINPPDLNDYTYNDVDLGNAVQVFDKTINETAIREIVSVAKITEKQRTLLWTVGKKKGWLGAEMKAELKTQFGLDSSKDILKKHFNVVLDHFSVRASAES